MASSSAVTVKAYEIMVNKWLTDIRSRPTCISPMSRPYAAWESDGRGTRQPGQVLTEAATTNSLRVIRLLLFPAFCFRKLRQRSVTVLS